MNRHSLFFSSIMHSLVLGLIIWGSGSKKKLEVAPYLSTVPVDVAVVGPVTKAPLSRPRSGQAGSRVGQRKKAKLPQKKPSKKKNVSSKPKKRASASKTVSAPPKKGGLEKKTKDPRVQQDPIGDLIESVAQKEQHDNNPFLKNLDSQEGGRSETPITDSDSKSDYGAPEVGPMAISFLDKVRKMLEKEWHVPFTLKGGLLKVVLALHMNKDGTIRHASVLDNQSTAAHPSYVLAKNSAMKAVYPFYTKPLPLPISHYSQWKFFEFSFVREENNA